MRFLLILMTLISLPVLGSPVTTGEKYLLNRMNPIFRQYSVGDQLFDISNEVKAVYDFAVLGGAVTTLNLRGVNGEKLVTLPAKAIIRNVLVDVITQPVSTGSATVAFGANSTTDLLGATAKASLSVGRQAGAIVLGTASGYVKPTAAKNLTATIGTSALSAGKIVIYVNYVQGY